MEDKRAFRGIWIPKEIWLSKDLTLQEKVFIVEIDSLDNEKGCFASNKHFSDFFGLSIGRVSQVINSLKKKGYIDIEYIRENKEIVERIIKINKPPYPIYYSKEGYLENDKNPIKYSKEGYLENDKGNNTLSNNTLSNNTNIYIPYREIIDCLNQLAGTHYKSSTNKTKTVIKARWNEGFELMDVQTVSKKKCDEWIGTDMEKYLRPETLFGNKFENYLNQKIITKKSQMSRLDQMLQEEIYGKSRNNNHNQSNLLGLPDTNQQY